MKHLTYFFVALCVMTIASQQLHAETVTVISNSSSGIQGANMTATFDDGTILGFYRYSTAAYFCGAISQRTELIIPDSILYSGTRTAVNYCGIYGSYGYSYTLDFDDAKGVISLTLPATITSIGCYIPSTIADLHLLGETPPSIASNYNDYKYIQSSTTVWVPQSAYAAYLALTTNSNSNWYGVELHPEGWEPQSYSVTVNTPGTFGNILLSTVSQWTEVDELTVIGHLSTDDLKLLTRLKQMRKLDLSQTDITMMTGCSGLTLLQYVLLPSTVTEVDASAFNGCSKLKEINIPNATSIGERAFNSCSSLTSVSLPAATTIGSYAFYSCSSLTSVSLPAATTIGSSAFSSCGSLTSVNLPAATTIGSSAFRNSSLIEVNMPVVKRIEGGSLYEYGAFSDCKKLTTIILPAVTYIGGYTFYNCSGLTSVNLPTTLQTLGSSAFSGCSSLRDVYCYPIVPITTTAFSSVGSAATLHVPAFSLTAYMLHDSWYSFYQIVPLEVTIDQLTLNDNFTIVDYTGLADKIDLTLTQNGHLTVSAGAALNIGTFTQAQATTTSSRWDSSIGSNVYTGISSLIANNEIKADKVNLRLTVPTNRWNFISFPFDVNVSDIEYPEETLWVIRKYSGADRAALTGNTWQNMTDGMVLQAGEGYILHCANESTSFVEFTFHAVDNARKNNIFVCQDVVKPLNTYASEHAHNRSWNLVGNPYPAYFDTHSIEHNGVITVYGSNDYYYGNSYTAYSLLDDDYVLRPNEAFFVQCPPDATSMTFKAEGRTHEYTNSNANYARAFKAKANSNRKVYNFTLSNTDFTDRARLVINPDAKMDYEISCDASKFMSDNPAVPQLYVYDNGIRYAIDERPMGDGIIALGVRFGQAGDYTIALKNNPAKDVCIMLTDNETGKKVNIAEESYTFTAKAGTNESRFTLTFNDDATSIKTMVNGQRSMVNEIYNLAGQRLNNPQSGVNIINGKKVMVK